MVERHSQLHNRRDPGYEENEGSPKANGEYMYEIKKLTYLETKRSREQSRESSGRENEDETLRLSLE
jgi:hypothetical protein